MAQFTLREWRKMREFSCEKMAKVCGVHVNTYMRYEKMPEKIPVGMAQNIAKALRTDMSDILFVANTTQCSNER